MQTIVKISLLVLCMGLVSAELKPSDMDLMQFMIRSRNLNQENPARSMACFDYYSPVLDDIKKEYETSYGACLKSSEAWKYEVDQSTYPDRKEIEGSAQNSCELLYNCIGNDDSIKYFECYANAGSENTKSMYTISANATEILAATREKFRLIDNEENRCTTASDRAFVEDSADTYDQLQGCLMGKTPVPTTTVAPITEPTTTTVTTEAPVYTTEESVPTTEVPIPTTETFNDKEMPEEDLFQAPRNRIAKALQKLKNKVHRN